MPKEQSAYYMAMQKLMEAQKLLLYVQERAGNGRCAASISTAIGNISNAIIEIQQERNNAA